MKKAISVLMVVGLSFNLLACNQSSPSNSTTLPTPTPTAKMTSTPTAQPKANSMIQSTPKPSEQPTPQLTPELTPDPPNWNTHAKIHTGMTSDEIIAALGKPDEMNQKYDFQQNWHYDDKGINLTLTREDESSPYLLREIEDYSWTGETIGKLKRGMAATKVHKLLGKPEETEEASEWGYDGNIYQLWKYPSKGVEMYIYWPPDNPKDAHVFDITVKAPYLDKTKHGIGIGSTVEEVLAVYGEGIYSEVNSSTESILVGCIFGGIILYISNGKVSEITIGIFGD